MKNEKFMRLSVYILASVLMCVPLMGCETLGIKQGTPTEKALEAAAISMGLALLDMEEGLTDVEKARAILKAGDASVQRRGYTSFLDVLSDYAATISQDRWTPALQEIVDFILDAFEGEEESPILESLRSSVATE